MRKQIALLLSVIIFILGSFLGCDFKSNKTDEVDGLSKYQATFFSLFNTVTFLTGYAKDEESFSVISDKVKSELQIYHELYDIYNNYDGINNIKTINDNAGIKPVEVDEKIIELLEFGKEAYYKTDGLTNMAMGSVLEIWHDYREEALEDPDKAQIPTDEELKKAAEHVNIEDVIIDSDKNTVFLADPEMSLDVGSIGKGYATEKVCQKLIQEGFDNILLSVGGNVRAIGKKPNGNYWEVGLENPYGGEDFKGIVLMDNNSLVTSGNYQRFYMFDGVKYHHIIDPNTLMPENYTTSVAILCEDSGWADVLSTAVFNMPPEDGLKWIEEQEDVEAVWMLNDETVMYSSGFKENLKKI